jgi:hypothetical protein
MHGRAHDGVDSWQKVFVMLRVRGSIEVGASQTAISAIQVCICKPLWPFSQATTLEYRGRTRTFETAQRTDYITK